MAKMKNFLRTSEQIIELTLARGDEQDKQDEVIRRLPSSPNPVKSVQNVFGRPTTKTGEDQPKPSNTK
jgi:hypothetical protein